MLTASGAELLHVSQRKYVFGLNPVPPLIHLFRNFNLELYENKLSFYNKNNCMYQKSPHGSGGVYS